jgi:protein-tyrosine phosphatase
MIGVRVTQPDRRIPLRNCANLRDVGGYPAGDGRTTRWRTLLRSGSLHFAGEAAAQTLADYGVRTVLDLRTREEADQAPSPPLAQATLTRRLSLIAEGARGLDPRLDAVYRYLIDERGDAIGQVISMLAAPGALPALVHCSAGKDRTGIVVGLALSAVGVPDEIVAEDYGLSAVYLGPRTPQIISQIRASVGLGGNPAAQDYGDLLDSPAGLFRQVLGWVRDAGGGTVAGYLQDHGVAPAELAALRENLTV